MNELETRLREIAAAIGIMAGGDLTELRQAFIEATALWARIHAAQYLPEKT